MKILNFSISINAKSIKHVCSTDSDFDKIWQKLLSINIMNTLKILVAYLKPFINFWLSKEEGGQRIYQTFFGKLTFSWSLKNNISASIQAIKIKFSAIVYNFKMILKNHTVCIWDQNWHICKGMKIWEKIFFCHF